MVALLKNIGQGNVLPLGICENNLPLLLNFLESS